MTEKRCFIKELKLENYRCFPELSLSFHDRLTVLVAPNGGGKTAALDALTVALRPFVEGMGGSSGSKEFNAADIRLTLTPENNMEPVTPVRLDATGVFLGDEISWGRERQSRKPAGRTTTVEAQELNNLALRLSRENHAWAERKTPESPIFPLIVYYGTGRLWSSRLTKPKKSPQTAPNARFRGYDDCLSSASHYKEFVDWFRRFSYEAKQESSPHEPQRLLGAVRQAVNLALQPVRWHTLEWDFAEDTVRANHQKYGRLPVTSLSDGIRTMIGLVADIAHRAVLLNPHLGEHAAAETPGIVLIDEVDMHLHPAWQQAVLPALQEAFPLVQFIVTTHSPQVLTTVTADCIRLLVEDAEAGWIAHQPDEQTRGVESAYAMAMVMNTDPIPPVEEARLLSRYHSLIQQHRFDTEDARGFRARLEDHFGSRHPVILECERMIRLERFKQTLPASSKRKQE